jgi:trehalose synthase
MIQTVTSPELALADYEPVVGEWPIEEIRRLARALGQVSVQHVNSTAVGGGVAEILVRLVPLMKDAGLNAGWNIIKGGDDFYRVTKAFHNALHGANQPLTSADLAVFERYQTMNRDLVQVWGDYVVVHDPQPLGLIEVRDARSAPGGDGKPAARRLSRSKEAARIVSGTRWIWRCHIDISAPDPHLWAFLAPWIERYDASIFSMPEFARPLAIPQFMITPAIDPLSEKNVELEPAEVQAVLLRHGIDPSRPVLTQISRFDRLKDPLGVIQVYRLVKKRRPDCQLVLAGGGATDDPEGAQVLSEVMEAANDDPDLHVLLLPPFSDREINALQRGSTVILQKSLKEGFGLTVTEALWKGKPVVGGAVGGIRLQILDGVTGFLARSIEGAAERVRRLLGNPALAEELGRRGREHVRSHFLITRNLRNYLLLMLALRGPGKDVIHI